MAFPTVKDNPKSQCLTITNLLFFSLMTSCGWMPGQGLVSLTSLFILEHKFREQQLAGCIVHTQGQQLKARVKPLLRCEHHRICSHSALCPSRLCAHAVACIWTAADPNHSPVRKGNHSLRLLHCPLDGTTLVRFCFLSLFACSFCFVFALPLKKTIRGNGNPRAFRTKGVSRMRWMEILQISP